MSHKESEEVWATQENMKIKEGYIKLTYPLFKELLILNGNLQQAISVAAGLERRLSKRGQLDFYNLEMKSYLDQGFIRDSWDQRKFNMKETPGQQEDPSEVISSLFLKRKSDLNYLRLLQSR